ncbi:hypothetical protein [Mangrovibacterium marinum]|uniref:Uncharacterized protein n=1 Tax=Mangrovibacterium marinum TaxID=1639118 RepID=A0A2T5BZD8_9BACT|nr:hypothetical protein [Mangrovibacterium marinum]PTN07640.1 hypothetical protein C8N47_11583 [Mangrovibacterium marinum]
MKYVKIARQASKPQINLNEFIRAYRSVHQLVAMKARNEKEDALFQQDLKRSAELLDHIHAFVDPKINQMLNFSFQYYLTKQEEALEGDQQAARIVRDLKPLYHKELLSLSFSN